MFLFESGLLGRRRSVPVPVLEAGRIYLRLLCQVEDAAPATDCLYQAGATSVQETEERA
jgi:hypothetical protein